MTNLRWDNGTGVVDFVSWNPDGSLGINLRGYCENRHYSVSGWRCAYTPASDQFSIPEDWEATNKTTINENGATASPTPVYLNKITSPDGQYSVSIGNQVAITNAAGEAVLVINRQAYPKSKFGASWGPDSRNVIVTEDVNGSTNLQYGWYDGAEWKTTSCVPKLNGLKPVKRFAVNTYKVSSWLSPNSVRLEGVRHFTYSTPVPDHPKSWYMHVVPGPDGIAGRFACTLTLTHDLYKATQTSDVVEEGSAPAAAAENTAAGVDAPDLAGADAQLNKCYQQLRERLNTSGRDRLKTEEVAWLKERDSIADPAAKLRCVEQRLQDLRTRLVSMAQQ